MKILALPRFPPSAATTRVRFLQYLPALEAAGTVVDVRPLFGQDYLDRLYGLGSRRYRHVLRDYGQRIVACARASRYDALWLAYEVLPMVPALIERLLESRSVPVVVDYDDASFHTYDQHPNAAVRALLGHKVDAVMRHARVVVAGNRYIAERARAAGAADVAHIPTVVDLAHYRPKPAPAGPTFTVGWMGSPATAKHLLPTWDLLMRFSAETRSRVLLVGLSDAPGPIRPGAHVETRLWRQEREIDDLHEFDIGIMPVPDLPFERGKCGYKLIQYLACGIPAIATPVGVNEEILAPGGGGLLAATHDQWEQSLTILRADATLRHELGARGRERVEREYALSRYVPELQAVLRRAVHQAR